MKKNIYKLFAVFAFALTGILFGCSDEETGDPVIQYIRITDPASSDSLVVAAGQGQMVAIIGDNLGGATQLWFNDQRSELNAAFISDKSIIARIPSEIPKEITDDLKLVFRNGRTLTYNFKVDISEPSVQRMKSEYVDEGGTATIYGDYFYEPLEVMFSGDVIGEIKSVEDQIIEVEVPAGAQPGPITITTNFGSTKSDFWFRDNRNIILDFDNMSGSGGQAPSSSSLWHPADGDFNYATSSTNGIPSINGNYLYNLFGPSGYGAWGWSEIWTGVADAPENAGLSNIPEQAFANPEDYNLKFELNTSGSLAGAWFNIWIGNDINSISGRGPVDGQPNPELYTWQPNIDTNGEWMTVTIPWSDFYEYGANGNFEYNPSGYDISIVLQGPNAAPAQYFAIDNVRVVPK